MRLTKVKIRATYLIALTHLEIRDRLISNLQIYDVIDRWIPSLD